MRPRCRCKPATPRKTIRIDMMRVPVSDELFQQLDADPENRCGMDQLKKRQDGPRWLVHRLSEARIRSEVAKRGLRVSATFNVRPPPVYPKKPVKRIVPLMVGGGAVGHSFLGHGVWPSSPMCFPARCFETWQIDRFFNLKNLGEIDEP